MNENKEDQSIARGIAAKRDALRQTVMHARMVQKHALDMERAALAELAELEVAERVLRGLPSSEEEISAISESAKQAHLIAALRRRAVEEASRRESQELVATGRQKDQVIELCREMLADGSWKTTEELHAGLVQRGVQLKATNQVQRVSQILSAGAGFRSQRGRGWSLDLPTPAQPDPNAEWEENLKRQAKRAVDNEHGSAR